MNYFSSFYNNEKQTEITSIKTAIKTAIQIPIPFPSFSPPNSLIK